MMKKTFFTFIILLLGITIIAQDIKDPKEKELELGTKMDTFISKKGFIIKYIDFKLPINYGNSKTKIRKVIVGDEIKYFYQIFEVTINNTKIASIAYEDLLEILKAIEYLKSESEKDIVSKPDFLKNKFVTSDGFEVGYYISKGKIYEATWFIDLDEYSDDYTIYYDNVFNLEYALNFGKQKIEELKKKDDESGL